MRIKHFIIVFIILLTCNLSYGQKQFKVVVQETDTWTSIYTLVDENEKLIRQLDTSKYYMCFITDQFGYFAIFGLKGISGWAAIDADEKVLFKVYNTSFGEPTPDYLVDGKIRIVDENNRIGFANNRGTVIIKPQFEIATSFHKGKAIIGQQCKKVPWEEHAKEGDCQHFSIVCNRNGYINEKGVIVKIGNHSFDQIVKLIDWKSPDE